MILAAHDYGPLTKLVALVACASSAGWAILATFRGRAKWEPTEEPLPKIHSGKIAGRSRRSQVAWLNMRSRVTKRCFVIRAVVQLPNINSITVKYGIFQLCMSKIILIFLVCLISNLQSRDVVADMVNAYHQSGADWATRGYLK
jgi:hypothetical protein